VLDLGGNRGRFAQEVQRRWGAQCVSVEANPALCANWPAGNPVINAAVSGRAGTVTFYLSDNSEGGSLFATTREHNGGQLQVPALSLDQIVEAMGSGDIALAKFDIEGAEIDVLLHASDAALRRFEQISVEFHDCSVADVSEADVQKVKSRLAECGFDAVSFSRRNTDVLFINRRAGLASRLELTWLRYVVRNCRGLTRVIRRMLVAQP
jgi:FkbM family methyltransferase